MSRLLSDDACRLDFCLIWYCVMLWYQNVYSSPHNAWEEVWFSNKEDFVSRYIYWAIFSLANFFVIWLDPGHVKVDKEGG